MYSKTCHLAAYFLLLPLFLFPQFMFGQCWPRAGKLIPDKSHNNFEFFGAAVDYQDNIAVVGASRSDAVDLASGVVYVFQFNGVGWDKIASLTPSDHYQYQYFGQSLIIHDDYIFVGDQNHRIGDQYYGAVYVFKKPADGWHDMVETTIVLPTVEKTFGFGRSIDFFDNALIVGAPYTVSNTNANTGAAFIFEGADNSWNETAKLSSNQASSDFGTQVAIKANIAVVVAEYEWGTTGTVGSAYVFEKSPAATWSSAPIKARLTVSSEENISYFGYGLAIDENRNTIFVSDGIYNPNNLLTREIRVYKRPATGWHDIDEDFVYQLNDTSTLTNYPLLRFDEPYLYLVANSGVRIFKPNEGNEWNSLNPIASLATSRYNDAQQFGYSIAARNGHVLIGAPVSLSQRDLKPDPQFKPDVYEFIAPTSGWANQTYLERYSIDYEPKTAANFGFGSAIDIDGDFAVIGSIRDNANGTRSGVAYVYQLINYKWKRIAILSPSDGEPNDFFGGSVAISGDLIAVGASNKNFRDETGKVKDYGLGAVYIFKKGTGWTDSNESYKLIKTDDGQLDHDNLDREDDNFGTTVDMDFPYLAVSQYQNGSRPNSGSVFVYNLAGEAPVLEATLDPSFRDAVNDFGFSLKIQGNTIIVGCGSVRWWFIEANAVFVFEKAGLKWTSGHESATLYPSDAGIGNYFGGRGFGYSIDATAEGNRIIIGAPASLGDDNIFDAKNFFKGAAYIYEKPAGGWKGNISETARLTVKDQPTYGCMGVSVHIDDRYAAVGSPQNFFTTFSGESKGPGRVYFFQMPASGWASKQPDKVIRRDETQNIESDYFGATLEGVFGFLMIGAIDDNEAGTEAGSVYIQTEYPFIFPTQTPICQDPNPVQLTAFPAGGKWSGAGFQNSNDGIFSTLLAGTGRHRINYKVENCDATNSLIIEVGPALNVDLKVSGADSFCSTGKAILTATLLQNVTYEWFFGTNSQDLMKAAERSNTLQATTLGYYQAIISNGYCSSHLSYQLVQPNFNISISPVFDSLSFCPTAPIKVEAQATPDAKYFWLTYINDEPEILEESMGVFSNTITDSGVYGLHVVSHGCDFISSKMKAYRISGDSVFVPNVITPNGDNYNDVFEIHTSGIKNYSMRIFDRYGKETFRSDEKSAPWSGNDAASGVYYWLLTYVAQCHGDAQVRRGTIHLIR
jgi:gliding motility-associated-like protein